MTLYNLKLTMYRLLIIILDHRDFLFCRFDGAGIRFNIKGLLSVSCMYQEQCNIRVNLLKMFLITWCIWLHSFPLFKLRYRDTGSIPQGNLISIKWCENKI